MKERPILMSAPMVRAILEGRKTQTRRAMKPQPNPKFLARGVVDVVPQWPLQDGVRWFMADGCSELISCPHGRPGTRLWLRETWTKSEHLGDIFYKATHRFKVQIPWRPSIFMPRWASRITLEVEQVRVERLQDISPADCAAGGISQGSDGSWLGPLDGVLDFPYAHAHEAYRGLWDSINGKKHPWKSNPFVWAITFKKV